MDFLDKVQVVNGEPSEKIIIVARKRHYAHEWCRIYEINPRSQNVKIITDNILGMLGITGAYYVDLGTDNEELRILVERVKSLDAIRPLLDPDPDGGWIRWEDNKS